MRGSACKRGLRLTTLRACAQVPSTTISVRGELAESCSGSRAPSPGKSRAVPEAATRARTRSCAPNSTPRCSSELGRDRWAILAVPMATRLSRGCCREQTRVRLCSGVSRSHQQTFAGRWQRLQTVRGRKSKLRPSYHGQERETYLHFFALQMLGLPHCA